MSKLTIDNGKYEILGEFGCWARSNEKADLGTVRMIGGKLMYACSHESRVSLSWRRTETTYRTHWIAVSLDGEFFSNADIKKWKVGLLNG